MKIKLCVLLIISVLFLNIFFVQNNYAKYVMQDILSINLYIDKTPPEINILANSKTETFYKTETELIPETENITINTSDNIEIAYNEYYYNQTENNFDETTPIKFDNVKELEEEGYYKIVAVDTSGNITEIIILLDKSAPNVTVEFYKKSEISLVENIISLGNGGIC